MSNFNLENYETVKERKKKFYETYPDGSLVSELVFHEDGHCIIKGMVFRTKEDQFKNLPSGVGYAEEYKGQGSFANKTSWMENCCESAIGRGLDNAGFSGNNKCSREEIEKVERNTPRQEQKTEIKKDLKIDFNVIVKTIKAMNSEKEIFDYVKTLTLTDQQNSALKRIMEVEIKRVKNILNGTEMNNNNLSFDKQNKLNDLEV